MSILAAPAMNHPLTRLRLAWRRFRRALALKPHPGLHGRRSQDWFCEALAGRGHPYLGG